MAILLLLLGYFLSRVNSKCAYLNSGGIGIPLDYCHVASQNGTLIPYSWSCDSTGDLLINVWYYQSTCTGTPLYSGSYSDYEDVEDYSCTGSGSDCDGVVLKMYDDKDCSGKTWTKMRMIVDQCFESSDNSSMTLKCSSTTADAFIYGDDMCAPEEFEQQNSVIESDDKCTKVETCDEPQGPTDTPLSTGVTETPLSTGATVIVDPTLPSGPDACPYVNLGGTGVPLGYCHRVSTALSKTSYAFSCDGDQVTWTTFSDTQCSSELYDLDAASMYSVEGRQCSGDINNCATVTVKTYSNIQNQCSGSNWQVAQYVTGKCLPGGDGGSLMYVCSATEAFVLSFSDEECQDFTSQDAVDDKCYEVLQCSDDQDTTPAPSAFLGGDSHEGRTDQGMPPQDKGIVFTAVLLVVALIVVLLCVWRARLRMRRQISQVSEESQNYDHINFAGIGEGEDEVVITAFA